MVAGDEELELRHERKKVLPHKSSRNRVAACQSFYFGLGPSTALLGLLRGHQAGAAQHGKIGRMPLAAVAVKVSMGAVQA